MMHEKLAEMKMKMEEVKDVKETLLGWLKEEVNAGKDCFHVESAGQVTDMIKDLAKTEKDCAESLYYTIVSEAMLEGEEPSYGDMNMGYNHRHLSNGRFARTGRGSYGYHKPYVDQEPYIDAYFHDPNFAGRMNMGYDRDGRMDDEPRASKYGTSYDRYREARRHYTQSKDPSEKERMNHHAMEHVDNVLESVQEMWESSDDVMLKKRIVDNMSKILNQMK